MGIRVTPSLVGFVAAWAFMLALLVVLVVFGMARNWRQGVAAGFTSIVLVVVLLVYGGGTYALAHYWLHLSPWPFP